MGCRGRPSDTTWLCTWPAVASIPENLYEAASLEGAGKVKQFFMITLPLIWDNVEFKLVNLLVLFNDQLQLPVSVDADLDNFGTQVMLNYMYSEAYTAEIWDMVWPLV